jgi:hypothetical protein
LQEKCTRYYRQRPDVRILEIPAPRWTIYDVKYFDMKMAATVPMIHQERAYTTGDQLMMKVEGALARSRVTLS